MARIGRTTRVVKRQRKLGEVATPLKTMRNFCLECIGWDSAELRRCTAPKCWLYPWRFGVSPEVAKERGEDVE